MLNQMKAKIFNIQKFSLHDGPGIRTSVFFSRCNLNCRWCANPECHIAGGSCSAAEEYELDELVREVLKDRAFYQKSGGGVTLTGGECLLQFEFIQAFCQRLKENQIHIAIETAGAVPDSQFTEAVSLADFIYLDCKHYDAGKHFHGTGVSNEQIVRNMEWLAKSSKAYCVRIPVIPGFNDAAEDARGFCSLFQKSGVNHIELLPFHQFGESKYAKWKLKYDYAGIKQLHKEDLQSYKQVFIDNGFSVILN